MSKRLLVGALVLLAAALVVCVGPANASLSTFATYDGDYGYAQAGCGSLASSTCSFSETIPAGSTVVAAYLFSSLSNGDYSTTYGGTLDGTSVSYGAPIVNTGYPSTASEIANVTSIVTPVVTSTGGTYSFTVTESNTGVQDGEGLVVVYSNPAIATSTVGILTGFSAPTGDTSSINFSAPLDPTAPGFTATMAIMDGYSYDTLGSTPANGQFSNITVDGSLLTEVAGAQDSCVDPPPYTGGNGCLITVGGPNTGFTPGNNGMVASPGNPQTNDFTLDHEYYDLAPFITTGDTSITVNTLNPSDNDNIFEETFYVSGNAAVNAPPPNTAPEPSSMVMLALGLVALFGMRKRLGFKAFA